MLNYICYIGHFEIQVGPSVPWNVVEMFGVQSAGRATNGGQIVAKSGNYVCHLEWFGVNHSETTPNASSAIDEGTLFLVLVVVVVVVVLVVGKKQFFLLVLQCLVLVV